jgi:hypothetical protein
MRVGMGIQHYIPGWISIVARPTPIRKRISFPVDRFRDRKHRYVLWQASIPPMSFSETRWLDMRAFVSLELEMGFEDIGCITVTFKPD